MQEGASLAISGVGVGAGEDQGFRGGQAIASDRILEWRTPAIVGGVVEECSAVPVLHVDMRASIQQQG